MNTPAPLILTCLINPEAADFFNSLRKEHFPPERNYLDAHLTLFHHLPPNEPSILSTIREMCNHYPVINLEITEVASTGRGVAYRVDSPALKQLHHTLQQRWKEWLIPQDKQGFRPHITVQNKVAPETARMLQQELAGTFTPFQATALGLQVWEYLGGPWRSVETCFFAPEP